MSFPWWVILRAALGGCQQSSGASLTEKLSVLLTSLYLSWCRLSHPNCPLPSQINLYFTSDVISMCLILKFCSCAAWKGKVSGLLPLHCLLLCMATFLLLIFLKFFLSPTPHTYVSYCCKILEVHRKDNVKTDDWEKSYSFPLFPSYKRAYWNAHLELSDAQTEQITCVVTTRARA